MKKRLVLKIFVCIFVFFFALFSLGSLYTYLALTPIDISGESMSPNVLDREFGYLDHSKYAINNIKRGQIIGFHNDSDEDYFYIKRVIATPLETFYLRSSDGTIFINEEEIKQDYITNDKKNKTCSSSCYYADEKITLKENEYFVLGDNRDNSFDSAHGLGLVKKENIIGVLKVIMGVCKSETCSWNERDYRFITDWKYYL